jgi:hypothetical protein
MEPSEPKCPYPELDPRIVPLVRVVNSLPGIETTSSCQGRIDNHRPGEPWHVMFQATFPITPKGYFSIGAVYALLQDRKLWEVKEWRLGGMRRQSQLVTLDVHACLDCLYRKVIGYRLMGMGDPDEFAALLRTWIHLPECGILPPPQKPDRVRSANALASYVTTANAVIGDYVNRHRKRRAKRAR